MSDERPMCWMCAEGAAKDGAEIERLRAQVAKLREALAVIAGIGEGSTTAHSLPHIGRLARAAIAKADEVLGKEPVT